MWKLLTFTVEYNLFGYINQVLWSFLRCIPWYYLQLGVYGHYCATLLPICHVIKFEFYPRNGNPKSQVSQTFFRYNMNTNSQITLKYLISSFQTSYALWRIWIFDENGHQNLPSNLKGSNNFCCRWMVFTPNKKVNFLFGTVFTQHILKTILHRTAIKLDYEISEYGLSQAFSSAPEQLRPGGHFTSESDAFSLAPRQRNANTSTANNIMRGDMACAARQY